ncbi:MAG: hypothetical protein LAP85_10395 [Acidobacteriia bacterium]|nr:hypothetical protein [Terriglobia bacterium]
MKAFVKVILAFLLLTPTLCSQILPATGAEITEYLRGYARIKMVNLSAYTYGCAVGQTWRWKDGREAVRILIYQDPDEQQVRVPADGLFSVTFSARANGSETLSIQGWGLVELYSADPAQRTVFARAAPTNATAVRMIRWSHLLDGTLEVWIEQAPANG